MRFKIMKSNESIKTSKLDVLNYLKLKIEALSTDLLWNDESPYRNFNDEDDQILNIVKKAQKTLLDLQTIEILNNTFEIKTWGNLYQKIEMLGYDGDEYVSVQDKNTLIETDYNSQLDEYFVNWKAGGNEGYYVDVYPILKEYIDEKNRDFRLVMKRSIITGKFWDEERAEAFAIFLKNFLNKKIWDSN